MVQLMYNLNASSRRNYHCYGQNKLLDGKNTWDKEQFINDTTQVVGCHFYDAIYDGFSMTEGGKCLQTFKICVTQ